MAILLIKNGQKIYESQTGVVTESERKMADKLDSVLKLDIQKLSHHLTQRERIIINQYTEGEIDITDERVQSIIYKLQKMVVN